MKGAVLLAFLIGYCLAGPQFSGIGTTCDKKSVFVTNSFLVNPYPPSSGQVMNVTMAGSFSKTQYVSDISIRTSYNNGGWTYKYFDISQNCDFGQLYTFNFTITAGTGNGLYTVEVHLEQKEKSFISCWQFTYHV